MHKRAADTVDPSDVRGWSRLAKESPLGQTVAILYDPDAEAAQVSPVQVLELNGGDLDATQVQLTLGSPFAVPRDPAELEGVNLQNVSGGYDNESMAAFGDYPGTTDPITWPPFVYVIQWGIGGNQQQMMVDAVNGARVNLTCSFLRVFAAVAPDAINQPGTAGAYVLGGFVGPGWPTPGSAQRSICIGSLDSQAESDVFSVPRHARRATVIGAASPAAPLPAPQIPPVTVCYLRFFADPAGTVCVGNYIVNGNQPGPFPIPNGGQYFSVVSGMSASTPFSALFELYA
jgi:hypothetical protein